MAFRFNDLDPDFREKLSRLLVACKGRGVVMVPYQGLRTPHQQAIYWRQSRTRTEIVDAIQELRDQGAPYLASVLEGVGPQSGPKVTNALPGNSWHQWGEAVDCFWEVDGKAEWSTTKKVAGVNGYQTYAAEAKKLSLDAGYYWTGFQDTPHVQHRKIANPIAAGLSWPKIDQEMRARFGEGDGLTEALKSINANQDHIRLSYTAPEGWKVYETTDRPGVLYRSGMTICADGAPKAYHKDNAKALDYLANAGRPGNWWALVTDGNGDPVVQKAGDPAPGYYVSTTALGNPGVDRKKPGAYIDASTIPYFVLPSKRYGSFSTSRPLRLGDLGVALNVTTGQMSFAFCAETGPEKKIGEASIELAKRLGIPANPKHGGTSRKEILYLAFPGTGRGRGLSVAEIETLAATEFDAWGGLARLKQYAGI